MSDAAEIMSHVFGARVFCEHVSLTAALEQLVEAQVMPAPAAEV
jgi:hypothetical protein